MGKRVKFRYRAAWGAAGMLLAVLPGGMVRTAHAQGAPEVLDRVVAVVNNRAILWSDITDALHLSVLESGRKEEDEPNAQAALEQLVSRALIQQQLEQEVAGAADPAEAAIQDRVTELRKDLPACVRMRCTTDEGWRAFLDEHDLTETQVRDYVRRRLTILAFIETRFKQGIRISEDEVDAYYRDSLLPQYVKGEAAPQLKDVSPRIEEILLQQQVSALFSTWLENLRKQGDVEILDRSLEPSSVPTSSSGGAR